MRSTIVSPAQLKRYKHQLIAVLAFFLVLLIIGIMQLLFDGDYIPLFIISSFIILPIAIYKEYTKLRSIAYDEHLLYFGTANSPELRKVPFDNIRSIHMSKFEKIYKINFAEAINGIKAVHFKPTRNWGPFSNIKEEKKVHRLCDAVNRHLGITDPEQQLHVYQMANVI